MSLEGVAAEMLHDVDAAADGDDDADADDAELVMSIEMLRLPGCELCRAVFET